MCGIAGIYRRDKPGAVCRQTVMKMAEALIHRGPDDEGCHIDNRVGFGFRRLSIIDLSHGSQPMFNEDGSVVLVCNGEIYNYRELRCELLKKGHKFRTNCDVEVILHLYEDHGMEFLSRLNGQFAFALYDKKTEALFVVRDQVGIAPLFYSVTEDEFIFSSEIKAILRHPGVERKVDLRGLDQIITLPGTVSPTTMFSNIRSLKPGNFIQVKEGDVTIKEYWDLNYPRKTDDGGDKPEEYYIEELDHLLCEAVKYRLNADVPVGFYLSGGLDSSLIASIIGEMKGEENYSFSIAFHQHDIDERRYQQMMVDRLGSIHQELVFDWEDIAKRLRTAVYHSESPLKETYNTCSLALSEAVQQSNIKVILTGEGSDELFGGYVGYKFDLQRSPLTGAGNYAAAMEEEIRQKLWGDRGFKFEKDYFLFNETKQALYSEGLNSLFHEFDTLREGLVDKSKLDGRDAFHKRSYLDFKLRLADHLISDHGDRVSYANSIEARYPFLDINVIEFAKTIPVKYKLKDMVEKYVVKRCAARRIPQAIVNREKFSFVAPGSQYLIRQNIEWVNDLLSYETIRRQGYFNPDVVERLKKMYLGKTFNLNQTFETDLLMIVLTFGIFLEVFNMPAYNG